MALFQVVFDDLAVFHGRFSQEQAVSRGVESQLGEEEIDQGEDGKGDHGGLHLGGDQRFGSYGADDDDGDRIVGGQL